MILTGVAVVAITATLLFGSRPGPAPSQSPVAAASPTAVPQSPGPTASAPSEEWAPLSLQPIAAVATITPSAVDDAGVRPDSTFVLESLTSEPAKELAKRLTVTPAIGLKVAAGADAGHATISPSTRLTAGAVYRFSLRAPEGSLAGSWAFRARGPLRIVGTLPSDRATSVPVTTGIEVTFDQEGAADIAPSFSIEPAVTGRFERHGRTQVFVPTKLAAGTLYTVTIKAGLQRTGTDLRLEHDVVFRFETGTDLVAFRWIAGRDVLETSPNEAPIIGLVGSDLRGSDGEHLPLPPTVAVKVYEYESEAKAAAALTAFLAAPRWTQSSGPVLATKGLPLAVEFTGKTEIVYDPYTDGVNSVAVRFPARLDRGWYAVEIAGSVPAYAFLQVTRVSAWVTLLTDRTVLWVNDVVTHQPIAGATAALPGKTSFGTSGTDGVLNAATPAALLPDAIVEGEANATSDAARDASYGGLAAEGPGGPVPVVTVRAGDDVLLLAFDAASAGDVYRGEWWESWYSGDETYWSLLFTDRWQYRSTDSVATWGYLRARDRDSVPASVELRIVPMASSSRIDAPALVDTRVEPNARGMFSVQLSYDRATLGWYEVVAIVGGRVVASTTIDITVIHKPEYQLEVTVDHRAVVDGTKVRIDAAATFFDGTPAPGIPLRRDWEQDFGPTDATGAASVTWVANSDENDDRATQVQMGVSPSGPESGEIYAYVPLVVFPASEQLDASGTVASGRLKVAARLRGVDLAAVERQLALGDWNGDPGGRGIAGRRVSVVVTELIPVRKQIGTRYDYLEKVVVPIYSYDISRKQLTTTSIVSGTDGRFALDIAVPTSSHEYEVRLSTTDPAGRAVRLTTTVGMPFNEYWGDGTRFTLADGQQADEHAYGVGDPITWTMRSNDEVLPTAAPNRYLYVVAQRGLVRAQTSESPTFERSFRASDAPGIFIMGVRFTGTTYAPKAAAWANLDQQERRLAVTVTADRAGYRPGDDITLRVKAVDAGGRPVAADVVLQAVDEKLYAMGAAFTPDPLGELYRRVDSGIVRITSTHQVPTAAGPEGEGGAGGGDGPRADFRDMLAFVRLRTNADGLATTTIKASDDLTAWHVAASAVTADLRAGVGELLVRVGLPLFASVTVADEYLLADKPAIRMRAFGLELRAGDAVVFTVSSPSLGLAPTTVRSTAFTDTWLNLPALRLGRQSLDVGVVAPTRKDAAGSPLHDRLITNFDVVDSRLTVPKTGYGQAGAQLPDVPGSLAATYTFTDAGRARYLPVLDDLIASTSIRLDRGLAGSMARAILTGDFGRDPASLSPDTFDVGRYELSGPTTPEGLAEGGDWEQIGMALMPYGGADPWLAARVAITAPQNGRAGELRWLLEAIRADETMPRSLRIAAVAGLASLGADVFADVATIRAETDLTVFESINVGLAAAGVGDDATARAIERDLAAAHGQRLGPWVRLFATSDRDDVAEMTALFAVLAARVGDPLAPAMLDYARAHPSAETSHALESAATIAAMLERTPAAATSFAYTVDGLRRVVNLAPGDSLTVALTGSQRATLVVERLSGDIGVAAKWNAPADVGALTLDPTITLRRTAPGSAPANRLVTVDLRVGFTSDALDSGCYTVVEQVPSGLVPLAGSVGQAVEETIIWPSEVVGQQVTFCVPHDDKSHVSGADLRYMARVVSTGAFAWEPALMTIDGVPEVVTVTGAGTVQIDR